MTARQVSRFGSGNSVKRVEDDALLRGEGRFADIANGIDGKRVAKRRCGR